MSRSEDLRESGQYGQDRDGVWHLLVSRAFDWSGRPDPEGFYYEAACGLGDDEVAWYPEAISTTAHLGATSSETCHECVDRS